MCGLIDGRTFIVAGLAVVDQLGSRVAGRAVELAGCRIPVGCEFRMVERARHFPLVAAAAILWIACTAVALGAVDGRLSGWRDMVRVGKAGRLVAGGAVVAGGDPDVAFVT